ncbi:hypothetical protein D3C78_1513010 [compost metagenome]
MAAGINKNEPIAKTISPIIIPVLYPYFFIIKPAGNAITKYAINTAESTREACKVLRLNDLFKCGIRIGSRLCTKPHMKNSEVIMIKGKRYLFFVIRLNIWLFKGRKFRMYLFYDII